MSPQHFDSNGGDGFNGFKPMGQISLSMNFCGEIKGPHEMGHQFPNAPLMEQNKKPWRFHTAGENRGGEWREEEERERERERERGFGGERRGVGVVSLELNGEGSEEVGLGEKRFGHSKLCSRGHWRPHEDAKLKDLVAQFGPQNWNLIAEKLDGRSGKSCRLRWFNQLDPRINKRAFSEEEEERLLSAHKLYGNKWAMISRLFPGRTDNAVKNHWHVIMARRHRDHHHSGGIYRRRKTLPSCSFSPPLGFSKGFVVPDYNAASESTVSTVDESASTCTDLSLTPSARVPLVCLSRFSPVHRLRRTYGLDMGEEKALKTVNVGLDQFCDVGSVKYYDAAGAVTKGMDVDNSGNSDSNSEVSASESVGNGKINFMANAKNNNNNKLPFIDFLGVGAT
ncbi:transcription factor CSA-like isoform X2 [Rhododendron vialii]|uniref:transcription factor CSA-like isoform X2 n=1 Tax=Rhododendron vialii TaxID=182163 RepID=UPI00265DC25A|nr:transcription factor CSA-like isoform X2 [Rhododendron vialii]